MSLLDRREGLGSSAEADEWREASYMETVRSWHEKRTVMLLRQHIDYEREHAARLTRAMDSLVAAHEAKAEALEQQLAEMGAAEAA